MKNNKNMKEVEFLEKIKVYGKEYYSSKEDVTQDAFNIFHIISDLWYRENFHSDIIKFFLDPKEKHDCGVVFLNTFIQMLNSLGKDIKETDYQDAEVLREIGNNECGYIDVLIKSETTKKAIIIENKINNAVDMPRQIPHYYDYVTKKGYGVDAIVYLPLDMNKDPYKMDWSEEDKKNIDSVLVKIPAYDKSGKTNLVDDWLNPSILLSNNIDVASTLRQYSKLITKLNNNIMDTIVLEKFYNELLQGDNLKTALSVRDMLNDLPQYMAMEIKGKYEKECSPFSKVSAYSYRREWQVVFENGVIDGIEYQLWIYPTEEGYKVYFCVADQSSKTITEDSFGNFIQSVKSLHNYNFQIDEDHQFNYTAHFSFYEKTKLFDFINNLLNELCENK